MEARSAKDVVMPIADARGLRDEIALLLVELNNLSVELNNLKQNKPTEPITVQITGGTFK